MKTKEINEAINTELGKMLMSGLIDEEQHEIIAVSVENVLNQFATLPEESNIKENKVEIIDDCHQKFNGIVFGKTKSGHYRKIFNEHLFLHRYVYESHYGKIPDGDYVIHHKDFNKDNNDISNLQLLTRGEHTKIHESTRPKREYICQVCGSKFKGYTNAPNKYCSKACSNKGRWRKCKERQKTVSNS